MSYHTSQPGSLHDITQDADVAPTPQAEAGRAGVGPRRGRRDRSVVGAEGDVAGLNEGWKQAGLPLVVP